MDCLVDQSVPFVPPCRVAVELEDTVGSLSLEADAEEIREQLVVAPPAAHVVQRFEEQVGLLDRLQHRLAVRAPGDCVTERAGVALQDGRLEQELTYLCGLAFEHLFGQVVEDIAVAPGERFDERFDIGVVVERHGCELQPGSPSLGAGRQPRDDRVIERRSDHIAQQFACFLCCESQVSGAQLRQFAAPVEECERERRVGARSQEHVKTYRRVLQEVRHGVVHGHGVDDVVVVENEEHVVRLERQFVDHLADQTIERSRSGCTEERCEFRGDPRPHPVERGDNVAPEPDRIVLSCVERHPPNFASARLTPVGQQRGLSEAGRRADQRQLARPVPVEVVHETRARHKTRPRRRQVQLGRQHLRQHAGNGLQGRVAASISHRAVP